MKGMSGSHHTPERSGIANGTNGRTPPVDRSSAEGSEAKGHVLITGGAGFIGTNVAHRLLSEGRRVVIYDNLARPGVASNVAWLERTHGDRVRVEVGDVRNSAQLHRCVRGATEVFHFAAQVAVTTSLVNPIEDFEVNAGGTLNLLEALRTQVDPPPLLFTSTNKVYGGLEDVAFRTSGRRYEPEVQSICASGVSEERPLDFHSPYGCSKGAADQYVIDYARTFGIPAVVFRMSCIYGPHQFGTEDQGWVAHFLIRTLEREAITLYGDGMQVRDILYVEDLVDAMLIARRQIDHLSGHAFNIGGGPGNTVSLLELLDVIRDLHGSRPAVAWEEWRPGDQRYYVSDFTRFKAATGWEPQVDTKSGIEKLYRWLLENRYSRAEYLMGAEAHLSA